MAQEAFREIWETLSEDHAKPISDTLPPMYKYGKAVHDMMNEDFYGLTISWIEMRSPLKIGFLNVVVSAVVLAAILSGGTINCGSMSRGAAAYWAGYCRVAGRVRSTRRREKTRSSDREPPLELSELR